MAIDAPNPVYDEYGLEIPSDIGTQMGGAVDQLLAQAQQQPQPEQPTGEPEQKKEGVNLLNEASAVVGGGAIDAVESVGGFAELTGDTLKTGLNQLLGRPIDATQNPFDKDYVHGDANFLNIPDRI